MGKPNLDLIEMGLSLWTETRQPGLVMRDDCLAVIAYARELEAWLDPIETALEISYEIKVQKLEAELEQARTELLKAEVKSEAMRAALLWYLEDDNRSVEFGILESVDLRPAREALSDEPVKHEHRLVIPAHQAGDTEPDIFCCNPGCPDQEAERMVEIRLVEAEDEAIVRTATLEGVKDDA